MKTVRRSIKDIAQRIKPAGLQVCLLHFTLDVFEVVDDAAQEGVLY